MPNPWVVVKVIFWLFASIGVLCLLFLNLAVGGAALKVVFNSLAGWTGDAVFAWASLLILLFCLLLIPTLLAWKISSLKFMAKANKAVVTVFLLLCANLPLIPLLFAFHPTPVVISTNTSWLSKQIFGKKSHSGRFFGWLFDKDIAAGRVFLDNKGSVLTALRLGPSTGNFGTQGLARFEANGKIGFFDFQGAAIVPPTYQQAGSFADGHAFVKPEGQELFGIIDASGKVIVEPKFENIGRFKDGLAYVVDNTGAPGFINTQGEWILRLTPGMTVEPSISDGLVRVPDSSGTKYYDTRGNLTLEVPAATGEFQEGLAWAQDRSTGLFGYIDKQGSWSITAQYKQAKDFSDGLAAVKMGTEETWTFVDSKGTVLIKNVVLDSEFPYFKEGFCGVQVDGLWGFMDRKGKLLGEPTFSKVYPFSEGLAQVFQGDRYGFVNRKGEIQIQAVFVGQMGPERMQGIFEQGLCAAPILQSRLGLLLGNTGGPQLPDAELNWTEGQTIAIKTEGLPKPVAQSKPTPTPTPDDIATPDVTPSPEVTETPVPILSPTPEVETPQNIPIALGISPELPLEENRIESSSNKIYAFLTLSAEQAGKLQVNWISTDSQNDFQVVDHASTKGGKVEVFFANPPAQGWTPGQYRLEVLLNGSKQASFDFEIAATNEATETPEVPSATATPPDLENTNQGP